MTRGKRVFLLVADNRTDAEIFMHKFGVSPGLVRVIANENDRNKIIGLDVNDTPWLSIRKSWNAEMRDIYNVMKLRYGPVWSVDTWIDAVRAYRSETERK